MRDHQFDEEAGVAALRRRLNVQEDLPLGMRSRFEARLRRASNRRLSPATTAVVAIIAFVVAGMSDVARLSVLALPVLVLSVSLYVAGLRYFVGEPGSS